MAEIVKPRDIFNRLPRCSWTERLIQIPMPQGPYDGSKSMCTLLEMFLLVALARIIDAQWILEIGTGRGETALALALNTDAMITTVDIAPQVVPVHDQIVQVVCDSRSFKQFVPDRQFDLVFVDGAHDLETFLSDSLNAWHWARKMIVWHDFGNPEFPWIAKHLDHVTAIGSTMLAFTCWSGLCATAI